MERIGINGTTLALQVDRATANAPWVVFGNSLLTDYRIWNAQARAFSGRFNVLRYDQRGHGGSDVSLEPLSFDVLAADLTAAMDHYNIARAVYVGLSMGVPTGLAAYEPSRFSGLVLIDGQARSAPNAAEIWQERIASANAVGMTTFAGITAKRWLVGDWMAAELAAMMAATRPEGFAAAAGVLTSYDYTHILSQITCPVLLMAGAMDGKMPETMRLMADEIPDACFQTIENAGHVPCFEQPDAVNRHLLAFLESVA